MCKSYISQVCVNDNKKDIRNYKMGTFYFGRVYNFVVHHKVDIFLMHSYDILVVNSLPNDKF